MSEEENIVFTNNPYRGNSNIREGVVKESIPIDKYNYYVQEIIKCSKDPIYFAENYFTIVSPAKGKHIIKTYPRQQELISAMVKEKRLVTLAARQTGKTTSYTIALLHMCIFNEDKKALIMANKGAAALEFMSRIRLAYELLPNWLKPGIKEYNKGAVEFSNGSRIEASTTSADSARGKSCNILVLDEAAFIPKNIADELWSAVYPIISSSKESKVIMVSTPNGTGNLFHQFYEAGLTENEEGWTSFKFMWNEVPGRDEQWKRQQLASFGGDIAKFNQEFGCAFLGSTYTLIDPDKLTDFKRKLENNPQDPIRIIDIEGYEIKIFEEPDYEKCYVIGGDVADGVGGDSSVLIVYDITDPLYIKEVAHFAHKTCPIPKLAYIAANIGILYNMSQIMIEANGIGRSLIDILYTVYEYMNIPSIGHKKMGIHSTNKLKLESCTNFRNILCMNDADHTFKSIELLNEMENFEKKDTANGVTYKSRFGHDDYIMSSIWALYILNQDYIDYYYDVTYSNIDLQRFPLKLKSQYSKSQIVQDQTYYVKRLEDIKKIVDNKDSIKQTIMINTPADSDDITPFSFIGN